VLILPGALLQQFEKDGGEESGQRTQAHGVGVAQVDRLGNHGRRDHGEHRPGRQTQRQPLQVRHRRTGGKESRGLGS